MSELKIEIIINKNESIDYEAISTLIKFINENCDDSKENDYVSSTKDGTVAYKLKHKWKIKVKGIE